MDQQSPSTSPPDAFAQEQREELANVLRSSSFRRSQRQASFLQFVCDLTLKGEESKINEYLIAYEVFRRGPEYSPGDDSIVRRQAHSLRQKLQEYYANEGREDPIRIELPVGRYVPVFVRQERPEIPPQEIPITVPESLPLPLVSKASRFPWVLGIGLGALLVGLGWLIGNYTGARSRSIHLPAASPAAEEVWGRWLTDHAGVTICFSNPMTAVVKHFQVPLPENSLPPRMPLPPEAAKEFRNMFHLPSDGYLYFAPAISQAKMGEAVAGVTLATLFASRGAAVRTTQSRFLQWDDFRQENLILLGNDEANRWLDPLLAKLPLRLAMTEGGIPRRIVNTSPASGEAAEYRIEYSKNKDEATQEYALISMLNGVDDMHQLLLLNGLNTQATEMAAEYLTNAATLDTLLARLRETAPHHQGPWYFQAVLRAEVHDSVPTRASLLALRVL